MHIKRLNMPFRDWRWADKKFGRQFRNDSSRFEDNVGVMSLEDSGHVNLSRENFYGNKGFRGLTKTHVIFISKMRYNYFGMLLILKYTFVDILKTLVIRLSFFIFRWFIGTYLYYDFSIGMLEPLLNLVLQWRRYYMYVRCGFKIKVVRLRVYFKVNKRIHFVYWLR